MSEPAKKRPEVPTGKTALLTTKQKKPTKTGYIGYDTIWEDFHTEVKYTTPKAP